MIIPGIIGVIMSMLIIDTAPEANLDKEQIAKAFSKESGVVMGTMEKIMDLPTRAHDFFYPQNNLPQSKDRIINPQKIENACNFEAVIQSGVVVDIQTKDILWEKNADDKRSIASISKLMTALVFLDHNPGWETVYQIKKEDRREGGRIFLYLGDEVKVKDLFHASLIGSANTATIALVNSTGMGEQEFVQKMNEKAKELGLAKTSFEDPVGLSNNNVSTALEVVKLAKIAFSQEDIAKASLLKEYEFSTQKSRSVNIHSTDYLLENFPENGINIIGGKTGYIETAGFCFVGKFKNSQNKEIISVILGAESNDHRFLETKNLVGWVFANYEWP